MKKVDPPKIGHFRPNSQGFTAIVNSAYRSSSDDLREILEVFKAGDKTPIFYVCGERNATADEMNSWLKERGNRSLITDTELVAGWEDSTVIAIEYGDGGALDNMCLRAVSSLHVIKERS